MLIILSTWEVEGGRSQIQGQPGPHSKIQSDFVCFFLMGLEFELKAYICKEGACRAGTLKKVCG
jgi:hypothetical protein